MEEVRSKGKLKGFTDAILAAARSRADAVRAESDEAERAALENYRQRAAEEGKRRTEQAKAEAEAREEKRVMTETLAANRSLLQLRAGCAEAVVADVREKLKAYPDGPEYGEALCRLLERGLSAVPGAKRANVLLRRADIGLAGSLERAAGDVELSFQEGFFTLGGLIIEFQDEHRRVDLTFDTALGDLTEHISEVIGIGLEDANGKQ